MRCHRLHVLECTVESSGVGKGAGREATQLQPQSRAHCRYEWRASGVCQRHTIAHTICSCVACMQYSRCDPCCYSTTSAQARISHRPLFHRLPAPFAVALQTSSLNASVAVVCE